MYYLKHKNDIVAKIEISEDASRINIKEVINPDLLPLCAQSNHEKINHWWRKRAIPASRIKKLLCDKNRITPHQFLLKNLALSVTDNYWICKENANIDWNDVSFHKNDFNEDLHFSNITESSNLFAKSEYNPSASLGGDLDKRWIRKDGQIFLIKGNMTGNSYQQSLNEVFASCIHKDQGFDNHVSYRLIKLANGSIGCISPCFATEDLEFIPAWEIFDKYGYSKNNSYLEQYIENCAKEGVRSTLSRRFLDYQFLIDFIISNSDRHLSNFGVLRNANTLECVSPAPIFDSGNSMFYDGVSAVNYRSIIDMKINSLYTTERKVIENISNLNAVNLSKMPSFVYTEEFYAQDPALIAFAEKIAECFDFKKTMLHELQCGKTFRDISNDIISFYSRRAPKEKEDLMLYSSKA